jgi:hypothetical protein
MARVVFISCVSKKLSHRAKARDLYVSPLFRMNLAYAESLKPDAIFVLSAKYGLLDLEQEIEPYDQTLNKMSERERRVWAERVAGQLETRVNTAKDEAIFLAGENYRRYLLPRFAYAQAPLSGLSIGRQLQYLKRKLSHE